MIRRVHAGAIGDLVCGETSYYTRDLPRKATPDMPAQEARIRNWVFDKVLSGDILVEQNIHVLDIVNWITRGHPLEARGCGGRKARLDVDCWDHFTVTFAYPGDVHVSFNSTQFNKSYDAKSQRFFGTRGYAEASFGKGGVRIVGDDPWDANVDDGFGQAVPRKIAAFVDSIRSGAFQNEIPGAVESTLTAILGRTAAYTGKTVTWDELVKSDTRWDAKLDLRVYG
jgi:predicted dehydrogenase